MSKFYYSNGYLLNYKCPAVTNDGTHIMMMLVLILYHGDGDRELTAHPALMKESKKPSFWRGPK